MSKEFSEAAYITLLCDALSKQVEAPGKTDMAVERQQKG